MQKNRLRTASAVFIGCFPNLLIRILNPAQVIEKNWKTFAWELTKVENRERILLYLLLAISLVETGRWNKGKQAILAWPWTVRGVW